MAEARVVTPGGVDLQCEVRGRGTPLLLIHGWSLDQRVFAPQFADFSRRYRTITFDRRGYGRSGGVAEPARELDDIDAILDATCGDTPVHLLGMSDGAGLALRYLVTRPGRVRAAILQGPVLVESDTEALDDERLPSDEYVQLAQAGELDELRSRWLRHPMMSYGIHGRAAELLASIVGDYHARDLLEGPPAVPALDAELQTSLREVSVPVQILMGTGESEGRKQTAKRILELMPGAAELQLPGCGHMCNLGDPALYNRFAMLFLDAH